MKTPLGIEKKRRRIRLAAMLVLALLVAAMPALAEASMNDPAGAPELPVADHKDVRIACVGDSITYGVIPNTPDLQSDMPYPAVLSALMGDGFEIQNFGFPGATMTEKGMCYRDLEAYPRSLAAAADLYVIMLGTNDANRYLEWDAALYEGDLSDLVDAYRAASPGAVIYLMSPPAVFPNTETGDMLMKAELLGGELRQIVARVAAAKAAGYIDMFAMTENHPEWFVGDGFHPVDEGYRQMGRIVCEAILPDAETLGGQTAAR